MESNPLETGLHGRRLKPLENQKCVQYLTNHAGFIRGRQDYREILSGCGFGIRNDYRRNEQREVRSCLEGYVQELLMA